jgi:hypothetical protein
MYPLEYNMECTAKHEAVKEEYYDYSKDFTVLTPAEKRRVLKTAKNLLKLQRENALFADAFVCSPIDADKQV